MLFAGGSPYYVFDLSSSWRAIVLDAFDINYIRPCKTSDGRVLPCDDETRETLESLRVAEALLRRHNPSCFVPGADWTEHLTAKTAAWMPYNGAVGERQLAWFARELGECRRSGKRAVVFTHTKLTPCGGLDYNVVWNGAEVLDVLRPFAKDVCPLVISGHDHCAITRRDPVEPVLMHVSLASPLESPSHVDAWGVLEYSDGLLRLSGGAVGRPVDIRVVPSGVV